jgi:hypothetical protein
VAARGYAMFLQKPARRPRVVNEQKVEGLASPTDMVDNKKR